jgi:hypothetical protein
MFVYAFVKPIVCMRLNNKIIIIIIIIDKCIWSLLIAGNWQTNKKIQAWCIFILINKFLVWLH